MQIKILKSGLLSTLQDMGRYGYLAQAVPISGVMDNLSARLANLAVGNKDTATLIEFTYGGASFEALSDLQIAFSGSGAHLHCRQKVIPSYKPVFIPQGEILTLNNNVNGARSYLAIAGGWQADEVMGSRSTYLSAAFGGFKGRALQSGDILATDKAETLPGDNFWKQLQGKTIKYPKWHISPDLFLPPNRKQIRVFKGREWDLFHDEAISHFYKKAFEVGLESNRMGYRLIGEALQLKKSEEMLSTAVCPGTIQVSGNGAPILLMADCQTTGGYPRIAQVAAVDLPLCAQLKPGDPIYFKEITYTEAEMLYLERENKLQQLQFTLNNKFLV